MLIFLDLVITLQGYYAGDRDRKLRFENEFRSFPYTNQWRHLCLIQNVSFFFTGPLFMQYFSTFYSKLSVTSCKAKAD